MSSLHNQIQTLVTQLLSFHLIVFDVALYITIQFTMLKKVFKLLISSLVQSITSTHQLVNLDSLMQFVYHHHRLVNLKFNLEY